MTLNNQIARFVCRIMLITLLLLTAKDLSAQLQDGRIYMGIELNNILCGYSEISVKDIWQEEKPYLEIIQKNYISFKALGRDIDQKQIFTYHVDKETGDFFYHDSYSEAGGQNMSAIMKRNGDSLTIGDSVNAVYKSIFLPEGVILPNTVYYPHLIDDLVGRNLKTSKCSVFDVRTGKINEVEYEKTGEEKLNINNKTYSTILVKEADKLTGMTYKYWINKENGFRLGMEAPTGIRISLADKSVIDRLGVGNWDDNIFGKTNKYIPDITGISSMQVRVKLNVIPSSSPGELSVRGQSFKGLIDGNNIDGTFNIRHNKYSGKGSPSFVDDIDFPPDMQKYLLADDMIQSDNNEILKKAIEITEGSTDTWDATQKLAKWVIDNIGGSVIVGNAIQTYSSREGACGSQSFLMAAFCRAVGIPARVVRGCLYTPEYGGSFGSHAWNEIYMGEETGWIPIDVTIHERDYIDSGHIRLGIVNTTNTIIDYNEITILDYTVR